MRLIDADAIIPIALENKSIEIKRTDMMLTDSVLFEVNYLFKDFYEFISKQPTVCDLEQIREKIKHAKEDMPLRYYDGISIALDIIDKYTKGETT